MSEASDSFAQTDSPKHRDNTEAPSSSVALRVGASVFLLRHCRSVVRQEKSERFGAKRLTLSLLPKLRNTGRAAVPKHRAAGTECFQFLTSPKTESIRSATFSAA